jgi:phospholipid/cholesterol/gamma-HCH transport system ATP-binding protein
MPGTAAMPYPAIEAERLSVSYNGGPVLREISFSVDYGQLYAVLGQGGSGKSTLFRHLLALERPTAGRVLILGKDVARLKGAELADLRRRVGVAHQGGALLSSLTVVENVMLPLIELLRLDRRTAEAVAERKLRRLGLVERAHLVPARLSRGELKRAEITRAIAVDPLLLVCDDIFSGLDRRTQAAIFRLLRSLRGSSGMTVVIFTPAAEVALDIADRVAVCHRGRFIVEGSPDEIRASPHPGVQEILADHVHPWGVEDEPVHESMRGGTA